MEILAAVPQEHFGLQEPDARVSSCETDIDTFISIASSELDSDLMRSEKDPR
jgi:hypothetical protein